MGEAFIQMEADPHPAHGPQIHRLAVTEPFDGQAETAEDPLYRQADDSDQLPDPVSMGEGIDFAKDDAGELADAIDHPRSTAGIDGKTGQFPDIGGTRCTFTGKGGGEDGGQHIGIGTVEQSNTAA